MTARVTDQEIDDVQTQMQPYSVALLSWGPQRHLDQQDPTIGQEHQRRMVTLRRDGIIIVLCPIVADTYSGMAILNVPADEARTIMNQDPCVLAGIMTVEVNPCFAVPGDTIAKATST